MAGRIGRLREGYLHENLGCHLLRFICVVAQIPAYDDVGLDALATLLRPRDSKALKYAEGGTFGVQFKAASVEFIRYNWDEKKKRVKEMGHLQWLRDLELPFFVGVIDPLQASMALYTTQKMYEWLLSPAPWERGVELVAAPEPANIQGDGNEETTTLEIGGQTLANVKVKKPYATIHLGPPIIKYNIGDVRKDGFHEHAYDVMKAWLEIQSGNILSRKLGYIDKVSWEPGGVPYRHGMKQPLKPIGLTLRREVLEALRTPIRCLVFELLAKGNEGEEAPVEAVMDLMRHYGLDPDEERLVDQMRGILLPFRESYRRFRERAAARAAAEQAAQVADPAEQAASDGEDV